MNLKELKSRLDDDSLDLSLSELTEVPVKELAQLKKARKVDLSINKLTFLTDDFAVQLTHLVHLDLSQNQLRKLPDNFGRLVNLQRLELYKNQLKDLPLSFLSFKSLQWLDVKDNPLTPQLQGVCGDCLDAKQCSAAAKNVVKFMRDLDSNMERKKQQKLKEQRAKETVEAEARKKEESKAAEEKKRAREVRKQSKKARLAEERAKAGGNSSPQVLNGKPAANGLDRSRKGQAHDHECQCPERSFLGKVCSSLLLILTIVGGLTLIAALSTFWLCSSQVQLVAGQREYCNQAHHLLVTADLANQRRWINEKLQNAPDWVKAPLDIEWAKMGARIADAGRDAASKVKPGLQWAANQSKMAGNAAYEHTLKAKSWVEKSAPGWRKKTAESWEYAKQNYPKWRDSACKWAAHAMTVVIEYTLFAMEWTKDTVVHVFEQIPVYWENVKFYWHNMK